MDNKDDKILGLFPISKIHPIMMSLMATFFGFAIGVVLLVKFGGFEEIQKVWIDTYKARKEAEIKLELKKLDTMDNNVSKQIIIEIKQQQVKINDLDKKVEYHRSRLNNLNYRVNTLEKIKGWSNGK